MLRDLTVLLLCLPTLSESVAAKRYAPSGGYNMIKDARHLACAASESNNGNPGMRFSPSGGYNMMKDARNSASATSGTNGMEPEIEPAPSGANNIMKDARNSADPTGKLNDASPKAKPAPSGANEIMNDSVKAAKSTNQAIDDSTGSPVKSTVNSVNSGTSNWKEMDASIVRERELLKSKLFAKSAACDRGFGACTKDREDIAAIVAKLSKLSPETAPTRGINPFRATNPSDLEMALATDAPVVGAWQMVYTTAFDVLSLAASPLTLLQGIYQVIYANGTSVNVIDLAPRFQAILPVQLQTDRGLTSTLRARVFTTAKARSNVRIGLTFKRVAVSAAKFLNFDVSRFPKFGVSFPTTSRVGAGDNAGDTDPGFFDILYVDEDCLIIQQNAPGGIFVNIRSEEAMSSFLD